MTFEEKLRRLEEIVRILESGECTLSDAVSLFSEGTALSGECKRELDNAKQKIEKIDSEDGTENVNG